MSGVDESASAASWTRHYESLDDAFVLFAHEAQDYFERLMRLAPIRPGSSVLDFGCGFGYVAELLGQVAGELYVWDVACNMRERTKQRIARRRAVHVLALEPWPDVVPVCVDLVTVNSVVQYMDRDGLRAHLRRWRSLLKPSGRVLVSDLILPESRFLGEVVDSLGFAARRRFLWRSLLHASGQFGVYLQARRSLPLLRIAPRELESEALAAGLRARILEENLTYRRNRYTAVLEAIDD